MRKIKSRESNIETSLKYAKDYFLEELAMLLAIPVWLTHGQNSQVCEIYPGKNQVQENLQANRYFLNRATQTKSYSGWNRLILNPKRVFMEVYCEPSNKKA
jgi:hypothetical protein